MLWGILKYPQGVPVKKNPKSWKKIRSANQVADWPVGGWLEISVLRSNFTDGQRLKITQVIETRHLHYMFYILIKTKRKWTSCVLLQTCELPKSQQTSCLPNSQLTNQQHFHYTWGQWQKWTFKGRGSALMCFTLWSCQSLTFVTGSWKCSKLYIGINV